jgi:hypothetical protein
MGLMEMTSMKLWEIRVYDKLGYLDTVWFGDSNSAKNFATGMEALGYSTDIIDKFTFIHGPRDVEGLLITWRKRND